MRNDHMNFQPGQVWRYRTRTCEPESRATVMRVDSLRGQVVVSFALDNLKLGSSATPGAGTDRIGFVPLSERAAVESVLQLLREGAALPNLETFEEGYAEWRAAAEEGKAGFYTAPLMNVLQTLDDGLRGRVL